MSSTHFSIPGPDIIRQDYLFYTASAWMHWSTLDGYWECSPDTHKEQRKGGENKQQRSIAEVVIGPPFAYLCGSIGHGLTLVTKVVGVALFFFLSIGFGAYLAFSKIYNSIKSKSVSENLMEKRTFYFLMSGITFLDGLTATCVDTIGVACPPLAYKIHHFFHKHLVELIVGNKIAFPDINKDNYNATITFPVLLDPSSFKINYDKS